MYNDLHCKQLNLKQISPLLVRDYKMGDYTGSNSKITSLKEINYTYNINSICDFNTEGVVNLYSMH